MFLSLLLISAVPDAEAGAWVRDLGGLYAKVGGSTFAGQEAQTEGGAGLDYSDYQASVYAELGLWGDFQLAAYVPFVQATNTDGTLRYMSRSGGDAEVMLSRGFLSEKVALAGTIAAKIPLYGDRTAEREENFGVYGEYFPVPGDGQVDVDARVELGVPFPVASWGGWAGAYVGYRYRFGGYAMGVPWSAQLGLVPKTASGKDIGWIGVDASGVVNLQTDEISRQWLRVGGFGALKIGKGFAIEAYGGAIVVAVASRPGAGGGVGVSWTR